MDRLSVVAAVGLAVLWTACDEPAGERRAQRFEAVRAGKKPGSFGELCDIAPDPLRPLRLPELEGDAQLPRQPESKYRWVNVWATWCKPCVEELPLLARSFAAWKAKQPNQAVALTLLSVDADRTQAQQFIAARPELPTSLYVKDAAAAPSWLESVGLASGSSIPVHLVLDDRDRLACARSGGITAEDLERFRRVLFP